ncbi:MAG: Mov34/MPN/PAD-1 family protein [Clostridia bacterium]|nr:Mov34/MPN/PAD-1 family protein [Clostridia bacterium]
MKKFVDDILHVKVLLENKAYKQLLEFYNQSGDYETGGILVGYYDVNYNSAIITQVTNAPKDSICRRRSFRRGISGLSKYLQAIWDNKNEYYLGEWHSHPHSSAVPSKVDISQIKHIANNPKFLCSEPLLLVIGERYGKIELQLIVVIDNKTYMLNSVADEKL